MSINEKGFAAVGVALLSVVVIVLAGLTVFVVKQNHQSIANKQVQTATAPKGVEGITNKGLEEELKIEDQQATKDASSATDEINASGDLEGAYEGSF